MWDPGQYRRFSVERARPFFDLAGQAPAGEPRLVADLGCGPGDLTVTLAERWPGARVIGVDNSSAMIEAARSMSARSMSARSMPAQSGPAQSGPARSEPARSMPAQSGPAQSMPAGERLSFVLGDVRDWKPDQPVDVIVSNAVLQWVPDHLAVLARWAGLLADGGWLGIQVPGNHDQPSHAILRELASSSRWRRLLGDIQLNRQAADPAEYLDVLLAAGCAADAWETTYFHVLPGGNPVVEWYKGTGLRPVLDALTPAQSDEFVAEYGVRIREAYPPGRYGTVFPFRRVFATARRPA